VTGRGEAAQVNVARANATLFDVLRTRAAIGRTLTLADELGGRARRDRAGGYVLATTIRRRSAHRRPGCRPRRQAVHGRRRTARDLRPDQRPNEAADGFIQLRPITGWMGDYNNQANRRQIPKNLGPFAPGFASIPKDSLIVLLRIDPTLDQHSEVASRSGFARCPEGSEMRLEVTEGPVAPLWPPSRP
jgi:hypothetical protein